MNEKSIGAIEWRDLTVENAEQLKEFYAAVVGWQAEPVSMGDYDDFNMRAPQTGDTIAGVCHARGSNAKLPPQWMMYVRVADATSSAEKTVELGGEIIDGPRAMGSEQYYVIRDPAGAVLTVFS